MTSKKKRKRSTVERPTIHPRNKYSDNPPDFGLLASSIRHSNPSSSTLVTVGLESTWTDFNATRELTRVLLLHDHALNWWIPDGQLCPTVPNRSNYIHWIEDLLSSDILTNTNADGHGDIVRGFDIGTGANCIYPLLGASLLGWSFVGSVTATGYGRFCSVIEIHRCVGRSGCRSDVTDVALEWAERNVKNNPQISDLIEIRKVDNGEERSNGQLVDGESGTHLYDIEAIKAEPAPLGSLKLHSDVNKSYHGPPVLLGVVRDGEKFDFCMCNPPFFETMEEAGLNPKTSCGGTPKEMVCPGGEEAFISRIIQDSLQLKQSFRWYTSLVGRKSNLKILISKLREVGVTIVKTTEFVQGQTCRWGLAWSFMPPSRKIISSHVAEKNVLSFTLEGLQRKYSAIHVLESVESFFCSAGASSKSNASAFTIDITASNDHCDTILKNELRNVDEPAACQYKQVMSNASCCSHLPLNDLSFRISVFQQIPGTLLVRGSLQHKESPAAGLFMLFIFSVV
ncbi:hypothetical protein HYC85_009485 [Camellia sinensis]|uniref:U6 small nuclear RNA (adenine-(43)-N(6))-methyltransferase n=1 Tax=Camellia sinensis TaxID=4442 RepID=A0A7J7HH07_CAMSI|nr:hypothetical protein HYC85_009485 [Camellia sinensis]